jgi:hypothetical protein
MSIRDWLFCHFHNICYRHRVDKILTMSVGGNFYFYCPTCREERQKKYAERRKGLGVAHAEM